MNEVGPRTNQTEIDLNAALIESDPRRWWAGLKTISNFESEIVEILGRAMESPDPRIRAVTPRFIVMSGRSDLVDNLIASARRYDDRATINVVAAVGELGTDSSPVRDFLLESLCHTSKHVRTNATEALGKLRIMGVENDLKSAAEDRSAGVRLSAVEALSRVDSEAAIAALEAVARHSRRWLTPSAAISRLGSNGKSDARQDALRRIAQTGRWRVKRRARKELESAYG